jgi:hypothetical protein
MGSSWFARTILRAAGGPVILLTSNVFVDQRIMAILFMINCYFDIIIVERQAKNKPKLLKLAAIMILPAGPFLPRYQIIMIN